MTVKMARIVANFNRIVCFSAAQDTFHGNLESVNHPSGEPRQSTALYYYTATWDDTRKSHTTLFKPRLGSKGQEDKVVARRALVKDLLPPLVYRKIAAQLRKVGL